VGYNHTVYSKWKVSKHVKKNCYQAIKQVWYVLLLATIFTEELLNVVLLLSSDVQQTHSLCKLATFKLTECLANHQISFERHLKSLLWDVKQINKQKK